MIVNFKKLKENAKAPYRGSLGAAGFDLTAVTKEQIDYYHTRYGTGLAIEIPEGFVGLLFPRSSCFKQGMLLSNCVGVIDSDYRGEISAVFIGTHREVSYAVGDRICQLIIMPYPTIDFCETDVLSDTQRGSGGYGSTGK